MYHTILASNFLKACFLPTVADDELDVVKHAAAPAPAATPEAAMTSAESLCDFDTKGKEPNNFN